MWCFLSLVCNPVVRFIYYLLIVVVVSVTVVVVHVIVEDLSWVCWMASETLIDKCDSAISTIWTVIRMGVFHRGKYIAIKRNMIQIKAINNN